jgi:hypothetical protein
LVLPNEAALRIYDLGFTIYAWDHCLNLKLCPPIINRKSAIENPLAYISFCKTLHTQHDDALPKSNQGQFLDETAASAERDWHVLLKGQPSAHVLAAK